MKVANTVDLKNKTNKLLRQVMNGEVVVITYRGKPAASLTPLSEDELEDFVLDAGAVSLTVQLTRAAAETHTHQA
jgi:prevent-host-death family protein